MTQKIKWFLIGAGVVICIGIGILIGWNVKSVKTCPEIKDSIFVFGDTLIVYKDTLHTIEWIQIPAISDTDSVDMVTKSFVKDTTMVSNRDTIKIKTDVKYYPDKDVFDLGMNIEHKDYEMLRIDTVKINYIEIKEIEVQNPIWVTTTITSTVFLLLALIALAFGG